MKTKTEGPVEGLCKEIKFKFVPALERSDVLKAFVCTLVIEVHLMWDINRRIADRVGVPWAEDGVGEAVTQIFRVLHLDDRAAMDACVNLHMLTDQPDDGPCNHYLDMLSSCISAIRFGLESPCRSRHAASAAQHIWKHRYGVHLFDECTPAWQNDWARQKLDAAILSLLPQHTQPKHSAAPTTP